MRRRWTTPPRRNCPGRPGAAWIGAAAAALLAGCAATGLEHAAPPAAPAMMESAAARGFSEGDVLRGREVFIARCGECHALPPPARYTERAWRDILPRMARRARLGEADARSVEAYVLSARDAGAGGSPAK